MGRVILKYFRGHYCRQYVIEFEVLLDHFLVCVRRHPEGVGPYERVNAPKSSSGFRRIRWKLHLCDDTAGTHRVKPDCSSVP